MCVCQETIFNCRRRRRPKINNIDIKHSRVSILPVAASLADTTSRLYYLEKTCFKNFKKEKEDQSSCPLSQYWRNMLIFFYKNLKCTFIHLNNDVFIIFFF